MLWYIQNKNFIGAGFVKAEGFPSKVKFNVIYSFCFKYWLWSQLYSKWIVRCIQNFYSFFSATVLAVEAGNGPKRNETLWNKLTAYKDLTGISDEEMISIWNTFEKIQVREGNAFPKFRVSMSKPIPAGTVNPVFFDNVQFNEGIEYKNGVVLIMQPGYYTFTVQARAYSSVASIILQIKVENIAMTFGKRYDLIIIGM